MKTKDTPALAEQTDLSVIKIFQHVRTSIEKIDTPPLTSQALEVNEDAYAELGSDEPEEGLIFARIGMDFPKKYTDLPFSMFFDQRGAALSFGAQDFIYSYYEYLGKNEHEIAKNLTAILVGFANGQIALLNTVTQDNEKVQAWELLYRKPGSPLYDALATYAMFDSARKLKNREMITEKFANTADIPDKKIDLDILKLFTYETNWLNKFNRKQIAGLHVPLTRADWEKSVDTYYDDKADAFVEKVDRWANKDQRTFWEMALDAAKWRHVELMWWSVGLLLYQTASTQSLEHFHPAFIVYILFVIAATIYRRNKTFNRYYPQIRLLAYVGFLLSAIIFISDFDNTIWWFLLGVLALISFAENIFFDAREWYLGRSGKTDK